MDTDDLFEQYDQAEEERSNKPCIGSLVYNTNYRIRQEIRDLKPCYPNTNRHNEAAIYPPQRGTMSLREWHQELTKLWEEAPYSYEIPPNDKERIKNMVGELCSLDTFLETAAASEVANEEFKKKQEELLEEYAGMPKDMNSLLRRHLIEESCRGECTLHNLERLYINEMCDLSLTSR